MYPYSVYTPQTTQFSQSQAPVQTPTQPMPPQSAITWVDGEVGAKAQQLPAGWPPNTPVPLWDTNDTIIYLKSTNPMGMPNPLQRLRYTMEEQAAFSHTAAPALMSGDDQRYVTRKDFDRLVEEVHKLVPEKDPQIYTTKGGRSNESSV